MTEIAHVYKDAGLTEIFNDATDTLATAAINGGSGTGVFYVGTPTTGTKIEDATNPGVDQIVVSVADATPGSDVEASHIKLALTEAGLSSATGGASLNLGTVINYGSPVAVWFQWDNSTGNATYPDISIGLTSRVESAA